MGVLAKEVVLDRTEVLEDGTIQFRYARWVTEDGKRIGTPEFHRSSVVPGQPLAGAQLLAFEDKVLLDLADRVKTVAAAVWTSEVVKAHQDRVKATVEAAINAARSDAIAVAADSRVRAGRP